MDGLVPRYPAGVWRTKRTASACIFGSFHGVPGAWAFRRHLAENGVWPGAGVDVLREAIARVEDRIAAPIAA
jgi:hypothetical protein